MFCQEGRPLVVTIRVPFVSAVQVDSSDYPLEQPLTPDDHSFQRTEEEPIPNADDDDRDGCPCPPFRLRRQPNLRDPPQNTGMLDPARGCRVLAEVRQHEDRVGRKSLTCTVQFAFHMR
jgi:hypothetical protein